MKKNFISKVTAILMAATVAFSASGGTMNVKANNFLDATNITIGSGFGSNLTYDEKTQWASFVTTGDDAYYYLEGYNYSNSKSVTMGIYSSSTKSIATKTISKGSNGETTAKLLQGGTTYYVKITGSPSKTEDISYSFNVIKIDDDASNTQHGASFIKEDSVLSGHLEVASDVDYYGINTSTDGAYTLEASNDTEKSVTFYVKDEYDKTVDSLSVPAGSTKNKDNIKLSAGKAYYVKVSGGSAGDYSFSMNAPTDDYGSNFNNPASLTLNSPINGKIDYKGDQDIFRFTTGDITDTVITLSNKSKSTLNLKLYDEDQTEIKNVLYTTITSNNKKINGVCLDANTTYYLSVYAGSSSTNLDYSLSVKSLPDDYANEAVDATTLTIGKKVKGKIANKEDEDWFKYTPGKTIRYNMKSLSGSYSVTVFTMDDEGDLICFASSAKSMSRTLTKGTTYYFKVYTTSSKEVINYQFKLTK